MGKNTEPPKSWLSSSEKTFGQEMEDKFVTALGKLGIPEVPRALKDNDTREKKGFAIARATEDEDTDGIDFWFYVPKYKTWYPIDLTTTNNMDKLQGKRKKERITGTYASQGAELYLEKISVALASLFIEN